MSYMNLDELCDQEIRKLEAQRFRVIARDYGLFPHSRKDLEEEGWYGLLSRGIVARHNLWMLVEEAEARREVWRFSVLEFPEDCVIDDVRTEVDGHLEFDVPPSVRHAMCLRDVLADKRWRDSLHEFWRIIDKGAIKASH